MAGTQVYQTRVSRNSVGTCQGLSGILNAAERLQPVVYGRQWAWLHNATPSHLSLAVGSPVTVSHPFPA